MVRRWEGTLLAYWKLGVYGHMSLCVCGTEEM